MKINNDNYGGFIVSKNILEGIPVRYSFREESAIPQLNGWNLYSDKDDEKYINNADNFTILNAASIMEISPVVLEIFNAKYGTDLYWMYEDGTHTGFYDLTQEKEVSIEDILR